jgi:hypothetical protein
VVLGNVLLGEIVDEVFARILCLEENVTVFLIDIQSCDISNLRTRCRKYEYRLILGFVVDPSPWNMRPHSFRRFGDINANAVVSKRS